MAQPSSHLASRPPFWRHVLPRPILRLILPIVAFCALLPPATSAQQQYSGNVTAAGIGYYGCAYPDNHRMGHYYNNCYEQEVADFVVLPLNPSFVFTVGDNNYPYGEDAGSPCCSFDENHAPYSSLLNTFEPAVGNHGYICEDCPGSAHVSRFFLGGGSPPCKACPDLQEYLYYTYEKGGNPPLVEFFAVDSNPADKDFGSGVPQKAATVWPAFPEPQRGDLHNDLTNSNACWRVVYYHHPPYSAGGHESTIGMRPSHGWYYDDWGADIVFSGHNHNRQRFEDHRAFPYIINGAGGGPLYNVGNWPPPPPTPPPPGGWPARKFKMKHWGADYVLATPYAFVVVFFSVGKDVNNSNPTAQPLDVLYLAKICNSPPPREIGGVS